jgi:hypothetical protein
VLIHYAVTLGYLKNNASYYYAIVAEDFPAKVMPLTTIKFVKIIII